MSAEEQMSATIEVVAHDSARLDDVWSTLHGVVVPMLGRISNRLDAMEQAFGQADAKLDRHETILVLIAQHLGVQLPEEPAS